jgi:hypothetical protein
VDFDLTSTRVMPYQPATKRKRPSRETVMPLGSGREWGREEDISGGGSGLNADERTAVGGGGIERSVGRDDQIVDEIGFAVAHGIFCEEFAVAEAVAENSTHQAGLRAQPFRNGPELSAPLVDAETDDDAEALVCGRSELARMASAIDFDNFPFHAAEVEALLSLAPGDTFRHEIGFGDGERRLRIADRRVIAADLLLQTEELGVGGKALEAVVQAWIEAGAFARHVAQHAEGLFGVASLRIEGRDLIEHAGIVGILVPGSLNFGGLIAKICGQVIDRKLLLGRHREEECAQGEPRSHDGLDEWEGMWSTWTSVFPWAVLFAGGNCLGDRTCETGRGLGMISQEEHGLDQFEFHEAELAAVDDAIDTGVDGGIDSLDRAGSAGEDVRRRVGSVCGSAEVIVHAEVSGFGFLEDGVTELAAEEDERPLALRRDAVHELLEHDAGAAAEFVEEWLGGGGIVHAHELRAIGCGGDARLDDCLLPAEFAEFFFQGRGVYRLWPERGDNRDASGGEVAQVGFVRVPADEGRRVEDRDLCGFEFADPAEERFRLQVLVPAGADHDCVASGPVVGGIVPNRGLGLETAVCQWVEEETVVFGEHRVFRRSGQGDMQHRRCGQKRAELPLGRTGKGACPYVWLDARGVCGLRGAGRPRRPSLHKL